MTGSPSPESVNPTLFDAGLLADPHAGYARLRKTGPVRCTTTPDGARVWLVTRYADVRAALTDPRLSLDKRNARSSGDHGSSMPPELDAHLLNLDPPDHTRLRRLVSKAFTPRNVEGLRPRIQSRTDALLDALLGALLDDLTEPGADLMARFAEPLALAVICDVLGIPDEERPDFRLWTNTLRSPAPDAALTSRAAMGHMYTFLRDLIAGKRAHPTEDLLTRMIAARDDQDRLNEAELVALTFLLLFAGYDNAANLIGTALLALLTHDEPLRALRAGALPMDQVLDEALRWESPSMLASRRFALEDIVIGGVTVPAGERVWLSLVSANRDEAEFENPGSFHPAGFHPAGLHSAGFRPAGGSAHLGFGHGIHYCLGAALARLEADIAVTTVLRRLPTLRLARPASELAWCASFRNRGLRQLPVTWGPFAA